MNFKVVASTKPFYQVGKEELDDFVEKLVVFAICQKLLMN